MPARVLLNVDCGEKPGESAEFYALADLVNVACGGHAGDAASMREACERAKAHGAQLGAHPSYPDRAGFGRTELALTDAALKKAIRAQGLHLLAAARATNVPVSHVKFHGALYHRVDADPATAAALVATLVELFGRVAFLGGDGGALQAECGRRGLSFLREGFADRVAGPDGKLLPRSTPGAVVTEAAAAVALATALRRGGRVDTVCVHGDGDEALAIARSVRAALEAPLPPLPPTPSAAPAKPRAVTTRRKR